MVGLGSIISGALGGLFGIGQKFIELKEKKLEIEERAKERDHELLVMDKEGELAEKKMRIQLELEESKQAGEAFTQSQIYGNQSALPTNTKLNKNQTWWLVIIEAFSKAVRPGITVFYQLCTVMVFFWAAKTLSDAGNPVMSGEKAAGLIDEITFSILYLAEMCVCWWLGVSPVRKRSK